ncbi:MAG: dihydrodipicolinate synthase family protein [Gammaproteobacteria bacterium]
MTLHWQDWPQQTLATLRQGTAIPAHPLALTEQRKLDPRYQRGLSRYYLDAGAGGLAVGVHTTQFAIREAGMYAPVLEQAATTLHDWCLDPSSRLLIAGLCGSTAQACAEAETALALGYHAGLLSLAAQRDASEDELIEHCQRVAAVMPIMGFYLQTAVGGIPLSAHFWARFAAIENVIAIKIAPFDRYRTLDVVRGVVAAGAEDRVMLYTGNDDHIVLDLLTPFEVRRGEQLIRVRLRGGLLGHWSVWTHTAVRLLQRIQSAVAADRINTDLLALDSQVTDCNSAFFDVAHDYRGCIAGCHEVLRRQGLLRGIWCLDPDEQLSPGQSALIDRVYADYPELNDDAFVQANLDRWLGD